MKCPVCTNIDLVMTERSGIEIDYCPSCRGVWLDRGELDKIIERSAAPAAAQYPSQPQQQAYQKPSHKHYGKKKKGMGSLLGELFDFD